MSPSQQTYVATTPKSALKTPSCFDKTDTTPADQTQTPLGKHTPPRTGRKVKLSLAVGKKAQTILDNRGNYLRIQMRLKVLASSHDTSAGIMAMKLMKSWFKRMLEVDQRAALLPWKKSDMERKAVTTSKDFPSKLSKFRLYTDRFRPQAGSIVCLKLRIACVSTPKEFLS